MKTPISYNLMVNISKQGSRYVAYTPMLDISTSGKTKKDVQKKFGELVNLFFEELIAAGTIETVLTELGWKKQQKVWNPPKISSESIGVKIPALA